MYVHYSTVNPIVAEQIYMVPELIHGYQQIFIHLLNKWVNEKKTASCCTFFRVFYWCFYLARVLHLLNYTLNSQSYLTATELRKPSFRRAPDKGRDRGRGAGHRLFSRVILHKLCRLSLKVICVSLNLKLCIRV